MNAQKKKSQTIKMSQGARPIPYAPIAPIASQTKEGLYKDNDERMHDFAARFDAFWDAENKAIYFDLSKAVDEKLVFKAYSTCTKLFRSLVAQKKAEIKWGKTKAGKPKCVGFRAVNKKDQKFINAVYSFFTVNKALFWMGDFAIYEKSNYGYVNAGKLENEGE